MTTASPEPAAAAGPVWFTARNGETLPACQPETPIAVATLADFPGAADYYRDRARIAGLADWYGCPETIAWADVIDQLRDAQQEHLVHLYGPGAPESAAAMRRAEGEELPAERRGAGAVAYLASLAVPEPLPAEPLPAEQPGAWMQQMSRDLSPDEIGHDTTVMETTVIDAGPDTAA